MQRTVKEIQAAIRQFSPRELADFRAWFVHFDAQAWDRQIEANVAAGRPEALGEEALREYRAGRTTPL